MSKKKMALREKRYIHSCNWAVRYFYDNLSKATYYNIIKENSGSLIVHRMAKRLYKKRGMKS